MRTFIKYTKYTKYTMETTIKVTRETKERLSNLDISGKGKSFDMIVNDLITSYEKISKKQKKDYGNWEKGMRNY